jgi:hypothetical protein
MQILSSRIFRGRTGTVPIHLEYLKQKKRPQLKKAQLKNIGCTIISLLYINLKVLAALNIGPK